MKAKKIKENIYWVGAIDWDVRNFHGYLTQRGTTYNAYLIIDEKITLIDTVKPGFKNEMLARISNIIDPSKIERAINFGGFDFINHVIKKYGSEQFIKNILTSRNLSRKAVNYWCRVYKIDREQTKTFQSNNIWSPFR